MYTFINANNKITNFYDNFICDKAFNINIITVLLSTHFLINIIFDISINMLFLLQMYLIFTSIFQMNISIYTLD